MPLYLLAFAGGMLTIVSPCIMPIVPLLFADAQRSFRRHGLPLLLGLSLTFAIVVSVATVGAGWIVRANDAGRVAALVLLAAVGVSLLLPTVTQVASQPFVAFGGWLQRQSERLPGPLRALLIGSAIGFLWVPCAGPILGLFIAAAAAQGVSSNTAFLFLAFAIGAGTAMGAVRVAGGWATGTLRRVTRSESTVRRVLGVAVLAGVIVLAFGWERSVLSRWSFAQTAAAEELLIARLDQRKPAAAGIGKSLDEFVAEESALSLADEGEMPELAGATAWINSPPLDKAALKGKVVLINFWTYSCINCLRALPYVKGYHARHKDEGLVVIGIHTPEFPFEKVRANVEKQVKELGVTYPVAMDNDYRIWNAFKNRYWPAAYYVDAKGRIRYHHFGEGRYEEQERVIRKLLEER